jgi:DNA-binding transcriptional MerR regulator
MSVTLPELLESIPADGVSLETLADLANRALESADLAIDDKRTAERLDGRTIRFYQSLAIIPKPSQYSGRRACYDRQHLIRTIAAKQLQSEGYSLAQIQSELPGRSSDELLALLTELLSTATRGTQGASTPLPRSRAVDRSTPERARSTPAPRRLVSYEIRPGVHVTFDPTLIADGDALIASLARVALAHPPTTQPSTTQPSTVNPAAPSRTSPSGEDA